MILLAHFTAAEMPVTLAILLVGVILGFVLGALASRRGAVSRERTRSN